MGHLFVPAPVLAMECGNKEEDMIALLVQTSLALLVQDRVLTKLVDWWPWILTA
jgi:hypothetical protein